MLGDEEKRVGYVGFSAQSAEMVRNGWLQARYYSQDDSTLVRDFLSFDDVFEVNPFEIAPKGRGKARAAYRLRFKEIANLLKLKDLLPKSFVALSNGETRRVMLARELLKDPEELYLDDPYNGLDSANAADLTSVIVSLEAKGVSVHVRGDAPAAPSKSAPRRTKGAARSSGPAVVELKHITIRFPGRTLFEDFNWTIREGERWVLRGPNGAGKTTLMALITGDSPLAYGLDVSVFGKKRDIGCELKAMRRKIGMVSPEMQAYLGLGPDELLDRALSGRPKLLILDEPCMNLDLPAAKRLCRRVSEYLLGRPKTTAICIAHRPEHVPFVFDRELTLNYPLVK